MNEGRTGKSLDCVGHEQPSRRAGRRAVTVPACGVAGDVSAEAQPAAGDGQGWTRSASRNNNDTRGPKNAVGFRKVFSGARSRSEIGHDTSTRFLFEEGSHAPFHD